MDDKYSKHTFSFTHKKPIIVERRNTKEIKIIKDGVVIENPEEFFKENNINIEEILNNRDIVSNNPHSSFKFEYSKNSNPFNKGQQEILYNGKPLSSTEKNHKVSGILCLVLGIIIGLSIGVCILSNYFSVLKY